MTLFVTGSQSFIGRSLLGRCELLGIEAIGIDNRGPTGPGLTQADIRDPAITDLIPENAIVVHLAAISRDSECNADPRTACDVNVNGTMNVAAAAEKRSARQLIFASSEWVYGDVANHEVQLEDHPIDVSKVKSVYALTKIVGEQCLRLACNVPSVTVLRFGIVYGRREANWSAVESLFDAVRTQEEIKIGAARTARRFIHVDDIVSGILASRCRSGFEIFNLSGDRLLTLGEIVETSAQLWGREVKILETNASKPSVRNPDNAKARGQFGWKPETDILTGLADLKCYVENASKG